MRLFILQFLQFLFWLFFSELCLYVTNLSLYLVIQIFFFLRIGSLYLAILSLYLAIQFFLAILSLYLTIQIFFPQNWWFISCICKFILQFWVFSHNSEFIPSNSELLSLRSEFISQFWVFFVRIVSLSQLYFTFFLSILSRVAKSWKISSKFQKLSGIFGNLPGILEIFHPFATLILSLFVVVFCNSEFMDLNSDLFLQFWVYISKKKKSLQLWVYISQFWFFSRNSDFISHNSSISLYKSLN